MMATRSGTRSAGRRGRSLLQGIGGEDWVGWGDMVDSLASEGFGVGDTDEDRLVMEGDENDSDKVPLDGLAPIGPAPVRSVSGIGSEVVCGGAGICVTVGWTGDGDGSADELASGIKSLVVAGAGGSVDSGLTGEEVRPP